MQFGTKLILGGTTALLLSAGTAIYSLYNISRYENDFTREYSQVRQQASDVSKKLKCYTVGTSEHTANLEKLVNLSQLEKNLRNNPESEASIKKFQQVDAKMGQIALLGLIFGIGSVVTLSIGSDARRDEKKYPQFS